MQFSSHKICLLCGTSSKQNFCKPCYYDLPQIPANSCSICLSSITTGQVCGNCLTKPPAFSRTIAALRYTFPVDALIHAFKYRTNLAIAPILADLLIQQLDKTIMPDFIVPMPLHSTRLRERGFNQALEISRYVSKKCKIRLLYDACTRTRNTPSQTGLPWKLRKKNMRNAFSCKFDLSGKHVAIIDDVMTTGATLNELAHVLRQHGASDVSNWLVARALPESHQTGFK